MVGKTFFSLGKTNSGLSQHKKRKNNEWAHRCNSTRVHRLRHRIQQLLASTHKIAIMENHIDNDSIQNLMEEFMHENPYGDSRELAQFMYNQGFKAGRESNC